MKFTLTTDSTADIFRDTLDSQNIPCIPLTYSLNGVEYEDNFSKNSQYEEFYEQIKNGALPTTSQISTFSHEEFFTKIIENGAKNIIHISLSSGLSSTYESACVAATNLMEKFDGTNISIINTLSATQGNAYILDEALELRDNGIDATTAVEYLNTLASKLQHWVYVDDLHHLKRGGRVSGAAAYIGSLLNIKPILCIDDEGKLFVYKKMKGLNKSIAYIVEMVKEHAESLENIKFYIANANAHSYCDEMEETLKKTFPSCTIKRGWVGPVIGAHTGYGMFGVIFKSKKRVSP